MAGSAIESPLIECVEKIESPTSLTSGNIGCLCIHTKASIGASCEEFDVLLKYGAARQLFAELKKRFA